MRINGFMDEYEFILWINFSGHVECVKWLLANRANPNVRDSSGRTPVAVAAEYQHDNCVELLELVGW